MPLVTNFCERSSRGDKCKSTLLPTQAQATGVEGRPVLAERPLLFAPPQESPLSNSASDHALRYSVPALQSAIQIRHSYDFFIKRTEDGAQFLERVTPPAGSGVERHALDRRNLLKGEAVE